MADSDAAQITSSEKWARQGADGVVATIVTALETGDIARWRDDPVLTLTARHPAPGVRKTALLMAWLEGEGWQINRSCERDGGYEPTMTSVGDRSRLSEFRSHPAEDSVSLGACVRNEVAARIVRDFGDNPAILSGACEWVEWSSLSAPHEG